MSRIGKMPVTVPAGTKIDLNYPRLSVSGPKGSLMLDIVEGIDLNIENETIHVLRAGETKKHRALHGLVRTLIANMVHGVTQGFSKKLQVIGIGYRVVVEKDHLILHLGYSNPVKFPVPEGISVDVDKQNNITIFGIDKQKVGQVAADIRALRRVEPYNGKGIRYENEVVRRKVGKTKTSKG